MRNLSTDYYLFLLEGYPLYAKKSVVHAALASVDGYIDTLEGRMEYKADEHYIVSDDPPTHVWPVRRDIFEATYQPVRYTQLIEGGD